LLIKQINKPVFYAVKSSPVSNDATGADAISAGVDQVATIMETGNAIPGANLEKIYSGIYTIISNCWPDHFQGSGEL